MFTSTSTLYCTPSLKKANPRYPFSPIKKLHLLVPHLSPKKNRSERIRTRTQSSFAASTEQCCLQPRRRLSSTLSSHFSCRWLAAALGRSRPASSACARWLLLCGRRHGGAAAAAATAAALLLSHRWALARRRPCEAHTAVPLPRFYTHARLSLSRRARTRVVLKCVRGCVLRRAALCPPFYIIPYNPVLAPTRLCVCVHTTYIYIRVWVCVIHIYLAPPARQNSKFAPRPGKREIYRRYIVAGAAAVYVRVPAGEITRRGCATAYRARATSSCRRHRCCCCYYYCWSIPSAWDVRCVQCIEKSYIYMGLYMHIYI